MMEGTESSAIEELDEPSTEAREAFYDDGKTPARKRDWGSLVEHGGDDVLDQHEQCIPVMPCGTNYKSVMVADKASQG